MNLAGKGLGLALVCAAGVAGAQTPPAVIHPTPQVPQAPQAVAGRAATADPESSVTVQQIVARQEDHYAKIRICRGTAVYTTTQFDAAGQPAKSDTQVIYFAYEGPRSVNLVFNKRGADLYKTNQGQIPWKDVVAAFHVTGDTVYEIRPPAATSGTTMPQVMAMPFNPAVHENNPLVRFHPRQVADEQIPLRELARAIPGMAQRPKVYDVTRDGKPYLKIEFANANTPGELLDYIIDPNRGYLPVEITRTSGGKLVSKSVITIGHTPDGTWIPARRERTVFGQNGRPASKQSWYYEYFAINGELAPKMLSLMFFNLPLSTPVTVMGGKAPTAGGQQPAAATPPPTPTPVPTRAAPAPRTINL